MAVEHTQKTFVSLYRNAIETATARAIYADTFTSVRKIAGVTDTSAVVNQAHENEKVFRRAIEKQQIKNVPDIAFDHPNHPKNKNKNKFKPPV